MLMAATTGYEVAGEGRGGQQLGWRWAGLRRLMKEISMSLLWGT